MGGYYFPMFVDISTKRILVIGGGKIAARRVRTLLKFAEHIEVTAPEICDEMKDILKEEEKKGSASGSVEFSKSFGRRSERYI